MTPPEPRIMLGPGWQRVRLETGEVVEILACNGDVPARIEWPRNSSYWYRIAEVIGPAGQEAPDA